MLVLDPCCGSKMMWFDKGDPRVVFGDRREESHTLCDGRLLQIDPDMAMDFRALPFADGVFSLVVFDPPHLKQAGKKSWLGLKYGVLGSAWQDDIRQGFTECFRVLKLHGVLIFKWAEVQIKTSEILRLTPHQPLFGHRSGKRSGTQWMAFIKDDTP